MPHSLITNQALYPEIENSFAVFGSKDKLVSDKTIRLLCPVYIPIESNRLHSSIQCFERYL